jgi:heme o synthase
LPLSLCPTLFHAAGPIYLAGAVLLGLTFVWCALRFARELTLPRARQLFYFSLLYLPLLLTLLALDKTN